MLLQDILTAKGSAVYKIAPERTLAEAVQALIEHHIGSLLVCLLDDAGEERLVGIITERDLLLAHAGRKPLVKMSRTAAGACALLQCTVAELMSTDVVTGAPEDPVEQVMGLMTTRRIRHLPVLAEGRVVGIVSIGDVVKAQHDRLAMENRYMKDYIRG
jgi:CBS domain-containing protein